MSQYSDIISDGGMDPRADYEAKRKVQNLESSIKDLIEGGMQYKKERDALWVKTQEDEREINDLRYAVNQKLTQRTELLVIAEEMAEVIIGNGASVKDAVPIDKLDEFYKKWSIGEPFKRNWN